MDVLTYRPQTADPDTYYFSVWTDASEPKTVLSNGLLGYFEVNSRSAKVLDVASMEVVGDQSFEHYRKQLRFEHCIGNP